nr:hypothetical protein BaRGS_034229 [Batillaria attramentaria]
MEYERSVKPGSGGGDNLPGLVSDATLETAQIVVNVGILPVLVLCGFTGNVINMAVFLRQGLGVWCWMLAS